MSMSKAEAKKIFCDKYASEGITPDEVVLRADGKVVIDRRATYPTAEPMVVGEWS
jgi:hypothetical protein